MMKISAALVFCLLAPVSSLAETSLPNIVIYFSDDHSAFDMGAYGNSELKTPVLDQLASEGMRFTNVFAAASVCAPSRAATYTGLYPQKNGLHENHSTARPDVKSMPHYLTDLGYEVVLAGKVHVLPKAAFPFRYIETYELPGYLETAGDNPSAWLRQRAELGAGFVVGSRTIDHRHLRPCWRFLGAEDTGTRREGTIPTSKENG